MSDNGWRSIPVTDRFMLLEQYERGAINLDDVARRYNLSSAENAGRRIRQFRETLGEIDDISTHLDNHPAPQGAPAATLAALNLPVFNLPRYDGKLEIEADDVLVLSDLHMPFYSRPMVYMAIAYAMRKGIRTCVIAGDLLDFDNIKYWPDEWAQDYRPSESTVIKATRALLVELRRWFTDVYVVMGNHDVRHTKQIDGQLWLGDLLDVMDDHVTFSRYHDCYVRTGSGERVWIAHPRNASRNTGTVPRKLLHTQREKCHVMIGHTHRAGMEYDESGYWRLLEIGCCADPELLQYINLEPSHYPRPTQAFGVIEAGVPKLRTFDDDWPALLGDDLYRQWRDVIEPRPRMARAYAGQGEALEAAA